MKKFQVFIAVSIFLLSACQQTTSSKDSITATSSPYLTSTSNSPATSVPPNITETPSDRLCEYPLYDDGLINNSPNGIWTSITCRSKSDENSSYIRVFSGKENKDWKIYYKDYAGDFYVDRHDMLSPLHWSTDGQNLYIVHPTRLSGTIGLGPGGEFLLKLNLLTGNVQNIINGKGEYPQISFAFSKEDKYLLYIPQGVFQYKANILNLASQEINVVEIKGENLFGIGFAQWSEDSSKIVALVENEDGSQSLILLNLITTAQTIIIKKLDNQLYPVKWTDENIVLLSNNYYNPENSKQWEVDIRNGELTELP